MEIIKDIARFVESKPIIRNIYHDAFSGPPWFEDLSEEEIDKRLNNNISRTGFQSFLSENDDGQLTGGLWYDTPSIEELGNERGSALVDFAKKTMTENNIHNFVWEREVIVSPEHKGKGYATSLREDFLLHLNDKYPDGVLLLTRMMDSNVAIIKVAEKFGYQRSGIRNPSSKNPEVFHEYWYKLIK